MDNIVTWRETDNEKIFAYASLNGFETPVWKQKAFEEGPYAFYVRRNGCGHCCCAMAARLYGVEIDPYTEMETCVELWGEPEKGRDWYQTARGITEILRSYGISSSAFGVPAGEEELAETERLLDCALSSGHPVIFWSHPSGKDNPFSAGEHYVLAVGYDEDGNVVIANSGKGIQLCGMETVMEVLYRGATAENTEWGIDDDDTIPQSGGIVIV